MKIVVVAGNESMRKALHAVCEAEGHQVITEFGDGTGLLDYVIDRGPDVVCLAFEQPQVIDELKEIARTRAIVAAMPRCRHWPAVPRAIS